ncbi:peptide-methionine (S)-S-oxide reductase MsrA [Leptospira sp. 96542]|nr:peptide-methionine (S)-S-oxide reductase MsrA [Leptospira sp. 96542]
MKNKLGFLPFKTTFFFLLLFYFGCSFAKSQQQNSEKLNLIPEQGKQFAAFAEGCFWCSEHIFESIPGVEEVISGYAGGHTNNPTYESVNTETTGHAETVLVSYDPTKISYKELCRVFFLSHDPTTFERQGPDVGNSYRSILFYQTEKEKQIAESVLNEIKKSNVWKNPIVTEITELKAFYKAEDYHQNFIKNNPKQTYVVNVSIPRFEEFKIRYENYKFKK